MTWVVISSLFVAAAFVGTFYSTGQIWDAMNAAGIVSLLYVGGFLYRIMRPPVSPRRRWWTLGVSAVVVAGVGLHWNTMYRMTNWQYDALHTIHKVIFHGVAMDMMKKEGLRTLEEFYRQSDTKKKRIGEIFNKVNQINAPDSTLKGSAGEIPYKIFAVSVSDSQVVLVCQATRPIDGEDPHFKNFDGSTGMTQDCLRISKKGIEYEIQN